MGRQAVRQAAGRHLGLSARTIVCVFGSSFSVYALSLAVVVDWNASRSVG